MNCICNGSRLIQVEHNQKTGYRAYKKCPACFDKLPKPKSFDWYKPMGIDHYQTATGLAEHRLSLEEQRELLARH